MTLDFPLERFWEKVNKRNLGECWEWDAHIGSDGYGQFWYNGANIHAHRMAWMIRNNSEIPEGMLILHHCDNKRCVNPLHLYLGDYSDNTNDMLERARPEMFGRPSKFSDKNIQSMRNLYLRGVDQNLIAIIFKVSQSYISNLINNKRGTNLKREVTNDWN